MFVKLDIGNIKITEDTCATNTRDIHRIPWSDLSAEQIKLYTIESGKALSEIPLNHSQLLCDNPTCTDPAHIAAITTMYTHIVDALNSASTNLQKRTEHQYKQIPGWNDLCAELHNQARDAFLLWRENSKPRSGPFCDLMRSTRAKFKSAIQK